MMRGTFANVRIENEMLEGKEGGYTVHRPSGEETTVFEASERYARRACRWWCSPARSSAPASSDLPLHLRSSSF
nr:hypothetical protein [Halorussus salinisoli]